MLNVLSSMLSISFAASIIRITVPILFAALAASISEKAGVTKSKMTTYLKACQEGWAPAPTNDYQKAIWEETRKLPEKPLQIKFDPKKGR